MALPIASTANRRRPVAAEANINNTPNTLTAVTTPKASHGGYGTFAMTAAGVWVYALDDSNHAVQALNACDTLTDTFTVTHTNGTSQVVTITSTAATRARPFSAPRRARSPRPAAATQRARDRHLTDTDIDNPSNSFIAVNYPRESDACYGTFKMTADGVWTYKLDDKNYAVQTLDDGDTLTDTFTVKTVDGTPMVVTITIHGSNDADPNDFDHLATGKKVVSDGHSFIFGTPHATPSREAVTTAKSSMRVPAAIPSTARAKVTLSTPGPAMTRSREMTEMTRSMEARERYDQRQ